MICTGHGARDGGGRIARSVHPLLDTRQHPVQPAREGCKCWALIRTEEKEEKEAGGTECKLCPSLISRPVGALVSPVESNRCSLQQPDKGTVRKQEAFSIHLGLAGLLTTSFYSVSRQSVDILHTLTDVKVQTDTLHQNLPADWLIIMKCHTPTLILLQYKTHTLVFV